MSFRLALLMIVEMALWHREGISSVFGGSGSWRIDATWVGVWVVSLLVSASGGCLCEGCVVGSFLLLRRVASFLSFVRRLSCLLSELVRGVCSLLGVVVGPVGAIGQVFCASSWYVFSMVMRWSAALSILFVVIVGVSVSWAR